MPIKKCNDAYSYGCELTVEYNALQELDALFYVKNTHTGRYHMNTCKECVKRHRRELGREGAKGYSYKDHQRKEIHKDTDDYESSARLFL